MASLLHKFLWFVLAFWLPSSLQLTRFVCALHISLCFVCFAHLLPFRIFASVSYICFRFAHLLPFCTFASVAHIIHRFAHLQPFRLRFCPTLSFMALFIFVSDFFLASFVCGWFHCLCYNSLLGLFACRLFFSSVSLIYLLFVVFNNW